MSDLLKNERKWVMLKATLETMLNPNNFALSSFSEATVFEHYIKELLKEMDKAEMTSLFTRNYDVKEEISKIKKIVSDDSEGEDTLMSDAEYVWKKEIAKKIKNAIEMIENKK